MITTRIAPLLAVVALSALVLAACSPPAADPTSIAEPAALALNTAAPAPTASRTPSPVPADTATPSPTARPRDTVRPASIPTLTPTPAPPTLTPTPEPPVILVEPTFTPGPADERARVAELPLGEPGNYVNIALGYWVQYPPAWYTGFGNRPLLVSFSDLDPGARNRDSMRAEGCLIEINAATNIYGFSFKDLMGQMPRSFSDSERFELDGQEALRIRRSSGENPFDSEEVYVEHDERLLVLTFDHSRDAVDACRPVWEDLLARWQWFTPQFAVYRNTDYGYALSHPRTWFRFNPEERGISISNQDPSGMDGWNEFLAGAMLVETTVYDNAEGLSLKQWLAAQEWQFDLTNDIPLDDIVGVRMRREGPEPGIEEMSGFFQGPLGKIYAVKTLYPVDRKTEFRPIANAIIYSFEF